MDNDKIRVYFSASIRNAVNNEYISTFLPSDKFEAYLPQKITPSNMADESFPVTVYKGCLDLMNSSDMGLIILDAFGLDSCWECGWYTRSDKFLIGFVESSCNFLRDWMLKGGIDGLVTTNPRLYSVIIQDPILSSKPIKLINSMEELGNSIASIFNNLLQNRCKSV